MIHLAPGSSREALQSIVASELNHAGEGFWELSFKALGSECELFFAAANKNAAANYAFSAMDWLSAFEAKFSRFLPDSLVSRFNANAGIAWTDVDPETDLMLDLCENATFTTRGAFDATSLPLSQLWDWKRHRATLPTPEEIEATRALVSWQNVQRRPSQVFLPRRGMMLDFGGVGKEFAVDWLIQLGIAVGLKHLMVDLGGDISVRGEPPEGGGWYVGLEDPENTERCFCGIRLKHGAAVATSGDYRRNFQLDGLTYGHIVDPRTGWPVANGTRSATVIAPSCTVAGLLSTSSMLLGGTEAIAMLERDPTAHGCIWHRGQLHETRGFRRSILPKDWEGDDHNDKN